jgi:hypothetical protein
VARGAVLAAASGLDASAKLRRCVLPRLEDQKLPEAMLMPNRRVTGPASRDVRVRGGGISDRELAVDVRVQPGFEILTVHQTSNPRSGPGYSGPASAPGNFWRPNERWREATIGGARLGDRLLGGHRGRGRDAVQ